MKNIIFLLSMIATLTFASCNNSQKSEPQTNNSQTAGLYQCPMKCEGEKMYDKPGQCPVCNMDLEKVEGAHEHHEHDSTHTNH